MCACVHIDVIQRRIEQNLPPLTCSTIDKLQHTFSQTLLTDLDTRLGKSDFYRQWFQALHSKQRIRILKPLSIVGYPFPPGHPLLQYIMSAFFGHQEHVVSGPAEKGAALEHFEPFGIAVHTPSECETLRCDPNPIYTLTLTKATRHSPLLLQRYFVRENRILIYDRYLNASTAIALGIFAKKLSAKATVVILTQPDQIADGGNICVEAMLAANNSLAITLLAAAHETLGTIHDRHIFIGNRYSMRFSSGVDVFGKPYGAAFFNDEGSITVYDVFDKFHELTLKSVDGKQYARRVSACG